MFLRESGTRHSLLTKQKTFGDQQKIKSNSNKLTGTADSPHEILVESGDEAEIETSRPPVNLSDIPEAGASDDEERTAKHEDDGDEITDDKKFQLTTSYDGFAIWGWVLCLLVTRKGRKGRTGTAAAGSDGTVTSGQALMEEWIGTQMQPVLDED